MCCLRPQKLLCQPHRTVGLLHSGETPAPKAPTCPRACVAPPLPLHPCVLAPSTGCHIRQLSVLPGTCDPVLPCIRCFLLLCVRSWLNMWVKSVCAGEGRIGEILTQRLAGGCWQHRREKCGRTNRRLCKSDGRTTGLPLTDGSGLCVESWLRVGDCV